MWRSGEEKRDEFFRNLQEADDVLVLVLLWTPVRQDLLWCWAHFNEMTAKLMLNAKNPVSRLQLGFQKSILVYICCVQDMCWGDTMAPTCRCKIPSELFPEVPPHTEYRSPLQWGSHLHRQHQSAQLTKSLGRTYWGPSRRNRSCWAPRRRTPGRWWRRWWWQRGGAERCWQGDR